MVYEVGQAMPDCDCPNSKRVRPTQNTYGDSPEDSERKMLGVCDQCGTPWKPIVSAQFEIDNDG